MLRSGKMDWARNEGFLYGAWDRRRKVDCVVMRYKDGTTIGLCGGQGVTRRFFCCLEGRGFFEGARHNDFTIYDSCGERKIRRLDGRTMVLWIWGF